ncbi:MAG: fibrillarin-like rRNA/tRNA 2'-O-methyltransferase [archaeon]
MLQAPRDHITGLPKTRFDNVFFHPEIRSPMLLTPNFHPGSAPFGERLEMHGGFEFREWDPRRSKLGSAIKKRISQIAMRNGSKVLYLGASHGYTPSFVSDIVGSEGAVYCVEYAPTVSRSLVLLCEQRSNMAPILADANHPVRYVGRVTMVDVVFQDVAQRNQLEIFLKNCDAFLRSGGFGLLALKARSMDVARHPESLFKEVAAVLDKKMILVDKRNLKPYEKDHMLFVCKKR